MNPKLKRIIAIIALVFVGLFTASFIAFLVNKQLFNGALGYFAGGCGAVGLALFFVIRLSREYPERGVPNSKNFSIKAKGRVTIRPTKTPTKRRQNPSTNPQAIITLSFCAE